MKLMQALLVRVALVVVGAMVLVSASAAGTRPDDRAGALGVGAQVTSPAAAHPDSRPGIRGVGVDLVPVSPAAAHPDNRAGVRGVPEVAASESGTDWTTIGLGVGAGVAVVLVLSAAALTLRHGGHGPHRPVLGH